MSTHNSLFDLKNVTTMFGFKISSRKRIKLLPKNLYDLVALLILIVSIVTDTSILTIIENTSKNQQPGWRFCSICEANAPPRSFHCHVCKICILKREHHCVFTACCVGFYNYRYYMAFVTHLWIGTIYSAFLNYFVGYIWQWFSATEFYTIFYHIFPILFWMFGKIDTKLLGVLVMSVMFLHASLFLTSLMLYHWNLIINGQTNNERMYKVFKYKSRLWKDNITKVFGPNWLHTLIWFNTRSQLQGDGTRFDTSINISTHNAIPVTERQKNPYGYSLAIP
uniref:Palmitoyltransferase n=1 Tax=Strigamia maritima TaxID=126957 RepID=T1IY67_STRMM